ncbi:MAG: hypothetical protein R2867_07495 [Caldilineaceae bacterium]
MLRGPPVFWIFEPDGTLLGVIATPERPANCAWGDTDRKSLYLTAQTSLYRIRTKVAGVAGCNDRCQRYRSQLYRHTSLLLR